MFDQTNDLKNVPHKLPTTRGGQGGGAAPELTEAYLMILEDALRDAVRQRRTVHETSKDMLVKMFRWLVWAYWIG